MEEEWLPQVTPQIRDEVIGYEQFPSEGFTGTSLWGGGGRSLSYL